MAVKLECRWVVQTDDSKDETRAEWKVETRENLSGS
jgi:hypothetical protein